MRVTSTLTFTLTPVMPMNKGMQEVGGSVEAEMIKLSRDNFPLKAIKLQNLLEQSILLSQTFFQLHTFQVIELCQQS